MDVSKFQIKLKIKVFCMWSQNHQYQDLIHEADDDDHIFPSCVHIKKSEHSVDLYEGGKI